MAHSGELISHKSRNNRKNRAKKKFKKQQRLLREVVVPADGTIKLLTTQEIDNEIVVFDGGKGSNIRPPSEFVCFLIWGRYLDFSGMSCHVLLRSYGFHVGIHIIVFDASQICRLILQVPEYLGVRGDLFFFR